jgi:hypothetical protein
VIEVIEGIANEKSTGKVRTEARQRAAAPFIAGIASR